MRRCQGNYNILQNDSFITAIRIRFYKPKSGHNDLIWVAGESYWEAIKKFANSI